MNMKSILQKYAILATVLCTALVGCDGADTCDYGKQFSFSYESDGVCFEGLEERIDDEVFYIPETMYGKKVIKFSDKYDNNNYPKTIIFPESVKYIKISFPSPYFFTLDTERLEMLVILSANFKSLSLEGMTSNNNRLHSIILNTPLPLQEVSEDLFKNDSLLFYVPDDSLVSYLTDYTWSKHFSQIRPASEYSEDLSQFGIVKKDLEYKGDKKSYYWYYCDIPQNKGSVYDSSGSYWAHKNLYIVLNQENLCSNSYNICNMTDEKLYFYLIYDGNSSVCELKTFSSLDIKPTVSNPLESGYKRIFVYSNIPLNIYEYYYDKPESYSSLTKKYPKEYPGYEMTKIN